MAWLWFNAHVVSQTESNYVTTAPVALTALYQEADFHDCELSQVTLLLLETLYQSFNLQTRKRKVGEVNKC